LPAKLFNENANPQGWRFFWLGFLQVYVLRPLLAMASSATLETPPYAM
jgi:hypothetical protein